MEKPIVVIGAGVGGLTTAVRLARAGRRVVVLEKNEAVGGKMGEWRQDGFRWDTGPSVITMRHVLEALFSAAGRRLEDYVTLLPVEPLTRYFYADGVTLDATRDLPQMLAQIGALSPRDVEAYLVYLAEAARLYRITGPLFIYGPPPTWRTALRVSPGDGLRVKAWRTMQSEIERQIRSPHLRQLLGRFATYVGASPYQASSTLNVIAHVELAGGVWYPKGGIYAIAAALRQLAQELGVTVETNSPVTQIVVENGQARGVELADGRRMPAAAVVANVDVTTVYQKLLPSTAASSRYRQRLEQAEPSCSGFVMMLGVAGNFRQLAHHNIFFSGDYRREFDEIFRRGLPPDDPTIYVAITSKTDADHAPAGHENWFVLVNAPAVGGQFDWTREAVGYRQLVLDRLAARGVDVRGRIRVERILTPVQLAEMTGAFRGALYGTGMNGLLSPFHRPHNRARVVDGLYFVGGTTHPGGGVPMVMLSGKLVSEMVLQRGG